MLSIVINIKNGAKYLKQCLSALTAFNEIIILDNHSTDDTATIAKSYPNVKFFTHDFCGMGKLRNIAAALAQNDWLCCIDCDEIMSWQLREALLNIKLLEGYVYSILRRNYFNNQLIDTSSWQNDWVVRIYNRKQVTFSEQNVHESLIKNNLQETKLHHGYLYHFPYSDIAGLISKMQFYSTLYAKEHFKQKTINLYLIPLRSLFMFFKCYILKLGILQGFSGLMISAYNAIGVFSKYAKLYELTHAQHLTLIIPLPALIINEELLQIISNINQQNKLPQLVFFLTTATANKAMLQNFIAKHLIVEAHIINSTEQIEQLMPSANCNNNAIDNACYTENSYYNSKQQVITINNLYQLKNRQYLSNISVDRQKQGTK